MIKNITLLLILFTVCAKAQLTLLPILYSPPVAPPFNFDINNVRMRGLNLGNYNVSSDPWSRDQTNWATQYPNWLTPQIQLAATNGGNVVKLIFDYGYANSSPQNLTNQMNNMKQLLTDCRDRGLWVVVCLGGSQTFQGATSNQIVNIAQLECAVCEPFPNVLYIDTMLEANLGGTASYGTNEVGALISACRPFTTKRLTSSTYNASNQLIENYYSCGASNLTDIHQYAGGFKTVADIAALRAFGISCPIAFGEYGSPNISGPTVNYYETQYPLWVSVQITNCIGMSYWDGANAVNQTNPADWWGLTDSNLVVYPYRISDFKKVPNTTNPFVAPTMLYTFAENRTTSTSSTIKNAADYTVFQMGEQGSGGIFTTNDKGEGALDLHGTTDWYAIQATPATISLPLTISGYINPQSLGFMTVVGSFSNGGVEFRLQDDGTLGLLQENQVLLATSVGLIPTNKWTYVRADLTSAVNGVATFYTNGVIAGVTTGVNASFTTSAQTIGNEPASSITEYFDGKLSNIYIKFGAPLPPVGQETNNY